MTIKQLKIAKKYLNLYEIVSDAIILLEDSKDPEFAGHAISYRAVDSKIRRNHQLDSVTSKFIEKSIHSLAHEDLFFSRYKVRLTKIVKLAKIIARRRSGREVASQINYKTITCKLSEQRQLSPVEQKYITEAITQVIEIIKD